MTRRGIDAATLRCLRQALRDLQHDEVALQARRELLIEGFAELPAGVYTAMLRTASRARQAGYDELCWPEQLDGQLV